MTGGAPRVEPPAPAVDDPVVTVPPRGHGGVAADPALEAARATDATRLPRAATGPGVTCPPRAVRGAGSPPGAAAVPDANGVVRFGPGVQPPRPAASSGTRRMRRPRRMRGALLVLVALAAALWWWLGRDSLGVEGVTAGPEVSTGCHEVAALRATVHTDGGAGELVYRWLRSDGTRSEVLRQQVVHGQRSTDLVLHWQVRGPGRFRGLATVEVLAPDLARATTAFDYAC